MKQAEPARPRQIGPDGKLPMDGALIDAKAAGVLLGVPASWVLAEARADRIPHIRLGRYRRFRAAALQDWVIQMQRGPVPYRTYSPGHQPEGSPRRSAGNGARGPFGGPDE